MIGYNYYELCVTNAQKWLGDKTRRFPSVGAQSMIWKTVENAEIFCKFDRNE